MEKQEMTVERVLIMSDSHGKMNPMIYAIEKEKPDRIIHLGDGLREAEQLRRLYPDIPIYAVPGNCDCSMLNSEQIIEVEGYRILICHGHQYNVKMEYLTIELSAQEKRVDVALFGHTHQVFYSWNNGVRLFNPGSIGAPGYQIPPSYGMMTLDARSGTIDLKTAYIEEIN